MALSVDETRTIARLANQLAYTSVTDKLRDAYYEGSQRLEHIGLAVPPELRRFETVVNWPRLVVDALEERCDKKAFLLPNEDRADASLEEGWVANNLDSEASLVHLDSLIYGRGFVSVGTNEEDPEHPLITVESPTETVVEIDARKRRVLNALKLYGQTPDAGDIQPGLPTFATFTQPNRTQWLEKGADGRWEIVDQDDHMLGRVAVVPFFNRRRTGRWVGVSDMADAISLTDAAARSLTNLQIAGETHSVPQKWVLGMTKSDFVDGDGNALPAWQSYFSAIWANQNKDASVGQFTASSLSNFHDTVSHYAALVSGLYGLPMRYLGQNTANPPSADGIRADEARHIKRAERKMQGWGDQWPRVMAYYMRFRDGVWPGGGDRISMTWHDAATPTVAARADAIAKYKGSGIYSREGSWDELGWSEPRKATERAYFAAEALDPITQALARGLPGAVAG